MARKRRMSKKQWFTLILISFGVFFSIVRYTYNEERELTGVEKLLKDTFYTVERIIFAPFRYVDQLFEDYDELLHVYDEYKLLKEDLLDHAAMVSMNEELKRELAELKGLLSMEQTLTEFETVNANVIIRDLDGWNNTLTIDVGIMDGITADMAVVTQHGLIGRISKVYEYQSEVRLITSSDLRNVISASIQSQEESVSGIIDDYNPKTNLLTFRSVESEASLTPGEVVVSSGLGGVYPRGLLIGTVETTEKDQYDLTQIVKVKPYATFEDLRYVIVVKRYHRQ